MLNNIFFHQKGQVVIIFLLVVVVALAVGLSTVGRSVTEIATSSRTEDSSRAFSAAEAGLEKALRAQDSVSPASLENQAKYEVDTKKNLPDPDKAMEHESVSKNSIVQFWLAAPTALSLISNPDLQNYAQPQELAGYPERFVLYLGSMSLTDRGNLESNARTAGYNFEFVNHAGLAANVGITAARTAGTIGANYWPGYTVYRRTAANDPLQYSGFAPYLNPPELNQWSGDLAIYWGSLPIANRQTLESNYGLTWLGHAGLLQGVSRDSAVAAGTFSSSYWPGYSIYHTGGITPYYRQGSFDLYFGVPPNISNYASASDKPAVEVNVISYDGTKYTSNRYYYDSSNDTVGRGGFSGCPSPNRLDDGFEIDTDSIGHKTKFYCYVNITGYPYAGVSYPVIVRVKLLYGGGINHPIALKPVVPGGTCPTTNGCSLPPQKRTYTSTGNAGNSQRRLEVDQFQYVIPQIFDYAVFTMGELNK